MSNSPGTRRATTAAEAANTRRRTKMTEMTQLLANEMADQMRRNLEVLTPAQMGWPHLTPEQLIESERQCWLDEFAEEARKAAEAATGDDNER
jgi:hypothetical protein